MASHRAQRPWDADRPFTTEMARSAIAARFPDIRTASIEPLGSGWEFDVFLTGDGWVLRFPRRKKYARSFVKEAGVLDLVRPVLAPVEVPRVELLGAPGPHFPYEFRGHRFVPGVAADHRGVRSELLALQIGRALARLHVIPLEAARTAGVDRCEEACGDWLEEARAIAPSLREWAGTIGRHPEPDALGGRRPRRGSPGSRLIESVLQPALDWLESLDSASFSYDEVPRLLHNDLCPDHLLVDPDSNRLVGILDWTDAELGDPALDFMVLCAWQGSGFVGAALDAYDAPLDPDFPERLRFLARVGSLMWLYEAVERETDVAKHMEWVKNAFGHPNGAARTRRNRVHGRSDVGHRFAAE